MGEYFIWMKPAGLFMVELVRGQYRTEGPWHWCYWLVFECPSQYNMPYKQRCTVAGVTWSATTIPMRFCQLQRYCTLYRLCGSRPNMCKPFEETDLRGSICLLKIVSLLTISLYRGCLKICSQLQDFSWFQSSFYVCFLLWSFLKCFKSNLDLHQTV